MIVRDLREPATSLPWTFPSPVDEARARAEEFRRLSPEERWRQIAELMEMGLNMVRNSPRRAEIEQRMEAQEAQWQRLQRELFRRYGT